MKIPFIILAAALSVGQIFAADDSPKGPTIQVDTTDFQFGTFDEGQYPKVTHTFHVRNTSKYPLTIQNVKPGCGCTGVVYDTVIGPGKVGNITPTINMTGIAGEFHKSVTVTCNATNLPSYVLAIIGKVNPTVDVNKYFIRIKSDVNGVSTGDLTMRTRKADFRVLGMQFVENVSGGVDWQNKPPLKPNYGVTKSEKPDTDGYYSYDLSFNVKDTAHTRLSGTFVFATNHPAKDSITIRGMIEPAEAPKK